MLQLKRWVMRLVVLALLMTVFTHVFTHWVFDHMLHRVAAKALPQGSRLSFHSHLQLFPELQIHIRQFQFANQRQHRVEVADFEGTLSLSELWHRRRLQFTAIKGQDLLIALPPAAFTQMVKTWVFHWLRQKIGVAELLEGRHKPSKITLDQVDLQRLILINHGDDTLPEQRYQLSQVMYQRQRSRDVRLCFATPATARAFFRDQVSVYRIIGELHGNCIVFSQDRFRSTRARPDVPPRRPIPNARAQR